MSPELCFPIDVTNERGECFVQRFIKGFLSLLYLFFVMAMARSLGNKVFQTKACRRVETNNMQTIVVDMNERAKAKALVMKEGTSSAYFMVAIETVVIGKVYDHHATENLQIDKILVPSFYQNFETLVLFS